MNPQRPAPVAEQAGVAIFAVKAVVVDSLVGVVSFVQLAEPALESILL